MLWKTGLNVCEAAGTKTRGELGFGEASMAVTEETHIGKCQLHPHAQWKGWGWRQHLMLLHMNTSLSDRMEIDL